MLVNKTSIKFIPDVSILGSNYDPKKGQQHGWYNEVLSDQQF